jgi:S1-C subfamily serine protease
VVTALDGVPVAAREDVTTALSTAEADRAVRLTVRRGSEAVERTLRPIRPPRNLGLRLLQELTGMSLTEAPREGLRLDRLARGSQAERRGLRPGDLVLGANGRRVADLETLDREVVRAYERGGILLALGRGGLVYNLSFEL